MNSLADALPAKIKEMNEDIIPAYVLIIPLAPMTQITVNMMQETARAEAAEAKVAQLREALEEIDMRGLQYNPEDLADIARAALEATLMPGRHGFYLTVPCPVCGRNVTKDLL